uniref:Uncharacterized protein n=1 Tax=Rhizophora mucronata TaxID=61149 RepID=A0A2P2QCL4_RHIMU
MKDWVRSRFIKLPSSIINRSPYFLTRASKKHDDTIKRNS